MQISVIITYHVNAINIVFIYCNESGVPWIAKLQLIWSICLLNKTAPDGRRGLNSRPRESTNESSLYNTETW